MNWIYKSKPVIITCLFFIFSTFGFAQNNSKSGVGEVSEIIIPTSANIQNNFNLLYENLLFQEERGNTMKNIIPKTMGWIIWCITFIIVIINSIEQFIETSGFIDLLGNIIGLIMITTLMYMALFYLLHKEGIP